MAERTVPVECLCPPKADGEARHEGDTVTLRARLSFRQAVTIRQEVLGLYRAAAEANDLAPSEAEVLATLTEAYLMVGVESWSLVDREGKPLPVTRSTVVEYLLAHDVAAEKVGDVADELYSDKVVLPLAARVSTSSPDTPTPDSTSAPTESPSEDPTPSSPSSTTTTPTVVTGRTSKSRGGASSSSRSSVSAA